MGKSNPKNSLSKKRITFFLDECFPYRLANILQEVGYHITCWHEEFEQQQGFKDSFLIPYLGAKSYTWITKDDEAKKEHKNEILVAGISVVWVRGLARAKRQPKKNKISMRDLHRMLTDKLDTITQELQSTKKPIYYLMWMASGGKPVLKKTTLEEFFKKIE